MLCGKSCSSLFSYMSFFHIVLNLYFVQQGETRSHYENMSVQYEAMSKSDKNDIFRCKNVLFFLIFAQNIDCGDSNE